MAIEKHLNPSDIFDPLPTYEGDWVYTVNDNLRRNSLVKGDKNLFQEFINEEYIEPLLKIFNTKTITKFPVKLFSSNNENNIGRNLKFSKIDFFINLLNLLNGNIDKYGKTEEEHSKYLQTLIQNIKNDNDVINSAFSEAMKEKAAKLKDVLDNEINSKYFEVAMQDYARFKDKIEFSTFINNYYNNIINIQKGLLGLGDFLDRKIDIDKFASCFDPDIFYLLFARITLDVCYEREASVDHLDNSYTYLFRYKKAVDKIIKEDKKYDPRIWYTNRTGQKMPRYSRWQYKDEFDLLMSRHPEAKIIELPDLGDNIDKFRDVEIINKIAKIYSEESKLNWEFLPAGTSIKKVERSKNNSNRNDKDIDYDKLIQEVNMRIDIINASGYIGTPIKGLDTFSGYYAFIFPNGKVILEKFWENYEKQIPATGCATYVMNIDNFVEMSKISKVNLIEYIRTLPEAGIKRIFHTSINNWQRCLNDEINGTYRLEDALNFIESLKSGGLKNE